MKVEKYLLHKAFSPVIKNNEVIEDDGINGELIVYTIKSGHLLMTFLGKDIILFDPRSSRKVLFFRPYKAGWDTEAYPLKPNQWGKKASPLTNLVLRLAGDEIDYTINELKKGTIHTLYEVKDTVLSKKIREKEKRFITKIK